MAAAISSTFNHVARRVFPMGIRHLSQTDTPPGIKNDWTIFDIDNKTGIATISWNNPPINAFGIEILTAMKSNLEEAERNNVRGLILTSSLKNIFSAGFDVIQLYKPNREHLTDLISVTQDVTEILHSFPFPTAALINGHALGGGCIYAACCEYRVMMPKHRIGVIEVAVGIIPQHWFQNVIQEVLQNSKAELAFTQAKQFRTEQALRIGLVDEIVTDKAEGAIKCQQFINSFDGVNSTARTLTKRQIRSKLFTDKQADLKSFVDELLQPQVQEIIGAYVNSLKIKSKS